ncbi:hypothetical protein [Paraburkholderia silvatlantica]|nr:hypothetical protein [Paraburkholderia silvatlantica]
MELYDDVRWGPILKDLKDAPEENIYPKGEGGWWRVHGYKSYSEMNAAWKANIRQINNRWPEIHKQAIELVKEYCEESRLLNNAVSRDQFKTDSNQKFFVDKMSTTRNGLLEKVKSATNVADLRRAKEEYGDSSARMSAYIYDEALDAYLKWQKANSEKEALALSEMKLHTYKARANSELRILALTTAPIRDASGKPICHMLSVAIDLSDGTWESGRAGHKRKGSDLEAAFGFSLPTVAANANATENPHNCAELDALYKLKEKKPTVKMTDVFFISMMPGGSMVIPPCVNCQRWIREQKATASKFDTQ